MKYGVAAWDWDEEMALALDLSFRATACSSRVCIEGTEVKEE